jgi:hypothetical protein
MTIHVAILTAVGSAKSRAGAFDSAMKVRKNLMPSSGAACPLDNLRLERNQAASAAGPNECWNCSIPVDARRIPTAGDASHATVVCTRSKRRTRSSGVAASFIRELLKFEGARVPGIDPQNRSADEQRASGEEEELEAFPDLFFRLTR